MQRREPSRASSPAANNQSGCSHDTTAGPLTSQGHGREISPEIVGTRPLRGLESETEHKSSDAEQDGVMGSVPVRWTLLDTVDRCRDDARDPRRRAPRVRRGTLHLFFSCLTAVAFLVSPASAPAAPAAKSTLVPEPGTGHGVLGGPPPSEELGSLEYGPGLGAPCPAGPEQVETRSYNYSAGAVVSLPVDLCIGRFPTPTIRVAIQPPRGGAIVLGTSRRASGSRCWCCRARRARATGWSAVGVTSPPAVCPAAAQAPTGCA